MDWPVPDGSCKLGALVDEGPLKCLQDGADCLQVGADWTTESEGILVETGESSQGFLDDTLPMGTVGNEKGGLLTPPLREGVPVAIPDECEAGAALPGIPMWVCSTPDEATGTVAMQMGVGNWGLVAAQADPGAATRMVRKRGHRGDTVEAPNAKRSCSQARGMMPASMWRRRRRRRLMMVKRRRLLMVRHWWTTLVTCCQCSTGPPTRLPTQPQAARTSGPSWGARMQRLLRRRQRRPGGSGRQSMAWTNPRGCEAKGKRDCVPFGCAQGCCQRDHKAVVVPPLPWWWLCPPLALVALAPDGGSA